MLMDGCLLMHVYVISRMACHASGTLAMFLYMAACECMCASHDMHLHNIDQKEIGNWPYGPFMGDTNGQIRLVSFR